MPNKVVIMRGLPGSGKSHYVHAVNYPQANERGTYFSTDLYWYAQTGTYDFRPTELGKAHAWSFKRFISAARTKEEDLVVDNTNISAYEISPYVLAATAHGFEHEIVTVWNDPIVCIKRNVHNVPATVIMNMYQRLLTETLPPFWKHTIVCPE